MGMNKAIYLGPYIRVEKVKEKTETSKRKCPNEHEISFGEFCPQCGSKIINVTIDGEDFVGGHQIMHDNDFEDAFIINDVDGDETTMLFVPNNRSAGGKYLEDFDGYMSFVNSLDEELDTGPYQTITRMKDQYKDEILVIEKTFKNIQYEYGIATWWW